MLKYPDGADLPPWSASQTQSHFKSGPTIPVSSIVKWHTLLLPYILSHTKHSASVSFIIGQSLNCCAGFSEDSSARTSWAAGYVHTVTRISTGELAQAEDLYSFSQRTYLSIKNNIFRSPASRIMKPQCCLPSSSHLWIMQSRYNPPFAGSNSLQKLWEHGQEPWKTSTANWEPTH